MNNPAASVVVGALRASLACKYRHSQECRRRAGPRGNTGGTSRRGEFCPREGVYLGLPLRLGIRLARNSDRNSNCRPLGENEKNVHEEPDSTSDALRPLSPPPSQLTSPTTAPRPLASALTGGSSGAASVIGTDLNVIGNLQSKGEIQIEGQVQGDVLASRIVIGQNAKIPVASSPTTSSCREPCRARSAVFASRCNRTRKSRATFSTSHWRSSRALISKASRAVRKILKSRRRRLRSPDPALGPDTRGPIPP